MYGDHRKDRNTSIFQIYLNNERLTMRKISTFRHLNIQMNTFNVYGSLCLEGKSEKKAPGPT